MPRDFRRALAYLVPDWRPLTLIVALSGVNTVLSLSQPYLSKLLVDRALVADRVVVLGERGILEQGQPAELRTRGGPVAALFTD